MHRRLVLLTSICTGLFTVISISVLRSPTSRGLRQMRRISREADALKKKNAQYLVANHGEGERDPFTAAEEAYDQRAYPASDIPIELTVNAQVAFNDVKAHGPGTRTPGVWTLIGPSQANYPGLLNFTGSDYTTSGRITALAIGSSCTPKNCRVWTAAAGGGVWRTDNALAGNGVKWAFVSGSFATNAIGTLTYDAAHNVLYAGTGEPNASGDSEAGLGIYKSTDGGDTWTHLASQVTALATTSCAASSATGACTSPVSNGTYTGDAFAGRSISSIVVDPTNPSVLYVASARGVRGVSSVLSGGVTTNPPTPRPPFGLFKSTDGGATFSFIWDGNASVRGVNHVELDPSDHATVYAAAFQQGIWRSTDGGATFSRIKTALSAANNSDRAEFAVTALANSKTRMYVGIGNSGTPARFYRTDDATATSPTFTDLTTSQNINYCTSQCWYDNFVVTPNGSPDTVYLGGSYQYGELYGVSNSRSVLYSTNAGQSFTDVSWDASSPTTPNGLHPDQHALVVNPGNPAMFFEGSDGGLMRSSGAFADISSECASRGLTDGNLTLCQQLLSRVPTFLFDLNRTLSTLQFQSLSVNAFDPKNLMGGTQDNGTFETTGSTKVWPQIIYGDGGQSGFNAANPALRFNSFFGQFHDANFQNGDPTKWVIISAPIVSSPEGSNFYAPIIADPHAGVAGTIFQGSQSVWRTQDWGGNQSLLEANCPEFTTPGNKAGCGDFVRIGPAGATDLTANVADYRGGSSRAGGAVAALARTASDTHTLWAATNTGRVFLSQNADAAAGSVTWIRLDTLTSATADPGRFVTGIVVDPANPKHAWISYSGYDSNTPSQPGHVFEVTYNSNPSDAIWTRIDSGSGGLGNLPVTGIARDDLTGDIYASSDFGVMMLESGSTTWTVAGAGLPKVEVAGLTIVPGARKLYAATHGRSAWALTLP